MKILGLSLVWLLATSPAPSFAASPAVLSPASPAVSPSARPLVALRTPVEVTLEPATDHTGTMLSATIGQDISRSHTLYLANGSDDIRLRLKIFGIDPAGPSLPPSPSSPALASPLVSPPDPSTVASVVVLLERGHGTAPIYLTSYLVNCSRSHLSTCASEVVHLVVNTRNLMFLVATHQLNGPPSP